MKINIIGMGVMGYQIAALFHLLGYQVAVYSRSTFDTLKFKRNIKLQKKFISGLDSDTVDLKICSNISEIYDACTIEAISENLSIKKDIYSCVRKITKKTFLSNTSSLEPQEIADDVIGLHFFNPIYLKFIEICHFRKVSSELDQIITDIKAVDFEFIQVEKNRGYLGNYLLFNEIGTAIKLIELYGYSSDSVKIMYKHLYHDRDIFSILDLIGIDVAQNIFKNINEKDPTVYVPKCLDVAIEAGIFGKKNKTSILSVLNESTNAKA